MFFCNGKIISGPKNDLVAVIFTIFGILFFSLTYSILIGSYLSKNLSIISNVIVWILAILQLYNALVFFFSDPVKTLLQF